MSARSALAACVPLLFAAACTVGERDVETDPKAIEVLLTPSDTTSDLPVDVAPPPGGGGGGGGCPGGIEAVLTCSDDYQGQVGTGTEISTAHTPVARPMRP